MFRRFWWFRKSLLIIEHLNTNSLNNRSLISCSHNFNIPFFIQIQWFINVHLHQHWTAHQDDSSYRWHRQHLSDQILPINHQIWIRMASLESRSTIQSGITLHSKRSHNLVLSRFWIWNKNYFCTVHHQDYWNAVDFSRNVNCVFPVDAFEIHNQVETFVNDLQVPLLNILQLNFHLLSNLNHTWKLLVNHDHFCSWVSWFQKELKLKQFSNYHVFTCWSFSISNDCHSVDHFYCVCCQI